jgi:selenide,water dikinase
MAMATVPPGPQRQQAELLHDLMAGGLRELRAMGATLIGGHSIEGPTIAIGYSMLAEASSAPPRTKGRLRPGDCLVLTKPLGSGILLAAHPQARCRAEWFGPLLELLVTSNQPAAQLADEFDIAAMTDVTGFGLAGHLMEMLAASNLSAELDLSAIPLLPGVEPLVRAGIESTLAPANRVAENSIEVSAAQRQDVRYAAMFDPQTSGGLLLAVAQEDAAALLARLSGVSQQPCAQIGRIVPLRTATAQIHIA